MNRNASLIAVAFSAIVMGLGACVAPEPYANDGRVLADAVPEVLPSSLDDSTSAPAEPGSQPFGAEPTDDSAATAPLQSAEPNVDDLDGLIADAPTEMTSVMVYKVDNECAGMVPEPVEVPMNQPMDGAVGEVIATQSNGDFKLSGYRVNVSGGVATVDLRLAANSRRKLVSLSSCEQYALFGSLRETLTKNSQWGVRSVRFTERGEAIAL
ncbi:sporulation/spore germination protein [Oculatella sp. LEGE 06141]|uniref:sporulation/spore germination protein n=1 Tax=Oculatella sp. LEGE 06141 TaxID=1828648 RepID=UPI001881510E|nr:sporulation/spore germination protein [Oculatella sp. LEGE 06141]MBE9180317.1 sporulation/spore germination protein [Oculatella sp. LEGE 06141]